MLSKISKICKCRRDFDESKYLYFLLKNYESSEKCNGSLSKVTNNIDKENLIVNVFAMKSIKERSRNVF